MMLRSVSSFIASTLFFWVFLGDPILAIGVMGVIFAHEAGHLIVLCAMRTRHAPPIFLLFFGASISREPGRSRAELAISSLAGPLAGGITAALLTVTAFQFPWNTMTGLLLHLLALFGWVMNLFNMIPARPLDGGGALLVLGDRSGVAGILFVGVIAIVLSSPLIGAFVPYLLYENKMLRRRMFALSTGVFLALFMATAGASMNNVPLTTFIIVLMSFGALTLYLAIETLRVTPFFLLAPIEAHHALPPLPEAAVREKVLWTTSYLLLLGALACGLWMHYSLLPDPVRRIILFTLFS